MDVVSMEHRRSNMERRATASRRDEREDGRGRGRDAARPVGGPHRREQEVLILGDARYDPHYLRVREADDRARVIAAMADEDVVAALAAASRDNDPYLANVLASEAQNRLRRANALTRHLGEGAMATDANGLVTQVNPAAERMVGLPADRILHRHIHDVLHPDGGRPLHDAWGDCPLLDCIRKKNPVRREDDQVTREDGTPVHVAYTASPILRPEDPDEVVGAVVVFQDIGDRKAALERIRAQQQTIEQVARNALRELSQRKRAESILRSLIEASPDAQLLVARSGGIATANPMARRLFRAKAALEGGHVEDLRPGALQVVAKALDDFETGAFQLTARRPDGGEFPAEVMSALVSAEGEPLVVLAVRDVTARKRAEEARAHLAAIVHGSQDPIIGRALDGTITSWNPAAERLYGWKEEEVLGMPADVITPPDAEDTLQRILDAIREGRSIEGLETVRIHKDGRRIPVSINLWPVRDDTGRIVGAAAIHRNLGEVASARRRLEEATQVLGRIFETTHVGIAYIDPDLRFVQVNRACADALGLTADDLVGRRVTDLFVAEDARAAFERVLATGEPHRAFAEPHPGPAEDRDETTCWDWTLQPIREADGTVRGLLLTCLDVSARVRAETALRQGEARFRSVFERAPAGIIIVEEDLRVREANEAFLSLLGYVREEVVGRRLTEFVHPDEAEIDQAVALDLFSGGGRGHRREKRHVGKDGEVVWTDFSLAVVADGGGRPYAIGIMQDARERKRAENRLREREASLRAVIESDPAPVAVVDDAGAIRVANPALERMFGYHKDGLVGMPIDVLMPGADGARHPDVRRAGYLPDGHVPPGEPKPTVIGRRHDGEEFPIEVSLAPFRLGDETLVVVALRDARPAGGEAAEAREASRLASRSREDERERRSLERDAVQRSLAAASSLGRIESDLARPSSGDPASAEGLLHDARVAAREAADAIQGPIRSGERSPGAKDVPGNPTIDDGPEGDG